MEFSESDKYKLQVLRTLSNFQALEFCLKLYVSAVYKIIKHKVNDEVPFDYGYKDIENHPFEKVLALFKKLNSNMELQQRLNRLVSGRNVVAHKSLMFAHPEIIELLGGELNSHHENVSSMENELDQCVEFLVIELQRVIDMVPDKNT